MEGVTDRGVPSAKGKGQGRMGEGRKRKKTVVGSEKSKLVSKSVWRFGQENYGVAFMGRTGTIPAGE